MKRRSDKQYPNSKSKFQQKIRFLEGKLESLTHYLPETYHYLMEELDLQKRQLAEIEVLETYQQIESEDECSDFSSRESRRSERSIEQIRNTN